MENLMIKNRNEITGDKIRTKGVLSKEAEDRFDAIFRKKEPTERDPDPDWDEGRIDVIGQNGNDGEGYGWVKHDESSNCPTDKDVWIEVETWTAGSFKEMAGNLEWKYVKFYRVIPEKK
jgi:hypothetical protein